MDKVELLSDDERSEKSTLIKNRIQSREKAEYLSNVSVSVPTKSDNGRNIQGLREKAEYVEIQEQEEIRNNERNTNRTSSDPALSTIQHSWLLFVDLTDESEAACEQFIYDGGLRLFSASYEENPGDKTLLTLMLATLSNVSEHTLLRRAIMDDEYVTLFFSLLDSEFSITEGAVSILCNLASDGPDEWTVKSPNRESVLVKIERVVDAWNSDIQLQFSYNSLNPLFNLIQTMGTPACQKYALWILERLLTNSVSRRKYHDILNKEDGKSILKNIAENPITSEEIKVRIKNLVQKII